MTFLIESGLKNKTHLLVRELIKHMRNYYKNSDWLEKEVYKKLFNSITSVWSTMIELEQQSDNESINRYFDWMKTWLHETKYWILILIECFDVKWFNIYIDKIEEIKLILLSIKQESN